jgi:hypothetical protein
MPTKPKVPEGFTDARSAKARRGFTATLDGRRYLIAAGRRIPTDHPLFTRWPDRFSPSGEEADATAGGRSTERPPRPVPQPTRTVYHAVCAGDPPCDWRREAPSEAKAAQLGHYHPPA